MLSLSEIEDKYKISFEYKPYDGLQDVIVEIFNTDDITKYGTTDPAICSILGVYCHKVLQNYVDAVNYYKIAVEKGFVDAMNRLGCYYCNVEKNYPEAVYYYEMAVENGSIIDMRNLGYYYCKMGDYNKMMHYYKMAISKKIVPTKTNNLIWSAYFESMNNVIYYSKQTEDLELLLLKERSFIEHIEFVEFWRPYTTPDPPEITHDWFKYYSEHKGYDKDYTQVIQLAIEHIKICKNNPPLPPPQQPDYYELTGLFKKHNSAIKIQKWVRGHIARIN